MYITTTCCMCCSMYTTTTASYGWVYFITWTCHVLFILHQFIDSSIISTFWLLWIMLLWAFTHNFFFSLLLGIYLEVELPDYMVGSSVFNILRNLNIFPEGLIISYSHQQYKRFSLFSPLPTLVVFFLFLLWEMSVQILAHLKNWV